MTPYLTSSYRIDSGQYYTNNDLSPVDLKKSSGSDRTPTYLLSGQKIRRVDSPLKPGSVFDIKAVPRSPSGMSREASGSTRSIRPAYAPLFPGATKKTLDEPLLDLLEAVIRGQQSVINRIASLPNTPYDTVTLTKQLKEKLIDHAEGELKKSHSIFFKRDYQVIADQLAEQGVQFLYKQEKYNPNCLKINPLSRDYHPIHPQGQQKNPFTRQDPQSNLSEASTASVVSTPSQKGQPTHPQLHAQTTSIINEFNESRSPYGTKYPDYYQGGFFNPQETIKKAVPVSSKNTLDKNKILCSDYNNFHGEKIKALKNYTFFHQKQNGGYCQTVSVNNFLGDNIVTPDILHKKLNLGNKHIGRELTTSHTLELTSIIRAEQKKLLQNLLEASAGTLVTRSTRQAIKKAKCLIQELNCRACDLNGGDPQQLQKFIQAANKADINRLHLTFTTSQDVTQNTIRKSMHAIALRRDPEDPKLWIILDGNLPTHRISLADALQGYSKIGSIRLIARKDLFTADPSIPCYQIKRRPGDTIKITEPMDELLDQWHNLALQPSEQRHCSAPGLMKDNTDCWRKSRGLPVPPRRFQSAPAYLQTNF